MDWKHWYPCTNSSLQISIFQIREIFNISYFPQFNLSFEKKSLFPKTPKNHPKIYTKLPNSGQCNKHRDLASLETWPRYWQKGRVKRRENSLHIYPRLKVADPPSCRHWKTAQMEDWGRVIKTRHGPLWFKWRVDRIMRRVSVGMAV